MRSLAMSLGEVKAAARKLGFTKIRRDAEDTPWVMLENWNGFWSSGKEPAGNDHVNYYVDGIRVLVMRITEGKETWYILG